MATIAITGVAGFLGSRVQERLLARGHRVVGIDTRVPADAKGLVFREADVRSAADVRAAVADADVVVHLAASRPGDAAPDRSVDVDGARVVVDAALDAGVQALVVLSSAMVYGASDDNPVPLLEFAPLRAPDDFAPAAHKRLVEEHLRERLGIGPGSGSRDTTDAPTDDTAAGGRPRVVVLRPAMVIGTDAEILLTRALQGNRWLTVRGHHPPVQFVHVDDLAAAVVLAVEQPLDGPYNVAAEGWLSFDEARALLGRRAWELPEEVAFTATHRSHSLGLSRLPASALPWVMHPWVVSSRRLLDAGWRPTLSNRDLAALLAQQVGERIEVAGLTADRRTVARLGVAAAATVAGGLLAVGLLGRRHRDAESSDDSGGDPARAESKDGGGGDEAPARASSDQPDGDDGADPDDDA